MTLVCEVTFILSQLKYFCQSNVGVAKRYLIGLLIIAHPQL
jgi:hypothetical protein